MMRLFLCIVLGMTNNALVADVLPASPAFTYSPSGSSNVPIKLRIRNPSSSMAYIVAKVTDGKYRVVRPGTAQYLDFKQESFQYFSPLIEFDIDPRADTIALMGITSSDAAAIGHDLRLAPEFRDDFTDVQRAERDALIEKTAQGYVQDKRASFWKVETFKPGATKAYLEVAAPGGSITFYSIMAPPTGKTTNPTSYFSGIRPSATLTSYAEKVQDGTTPDVTFKRLPR